MFVKGMNALVVEWQRTLGKGQLPGLLTAWLAVLDGAGFETELLRSGIDEDSLPGFERNRLLVAVAVAEFSAGDFEF